jgi:hypothetical protein
MRPAYFPGPDRKIKKAVVLARRVLPVFPGMYRILPAAILAVGGLAARQRALQAFNDDRRPLPAADTQRRQPQGFVPGLQGMQ